VRSTRRSARSGGRAVAALIRRTGDWDLAEECAQDAYAEARRGATACWADSLSGIGEVPLAVFSPRGPSLRELAMQALSPVEGGDDLLAPKFDQTAFRTPDGGLNERPVLFAGVRRALRPGGLFAFPVGAPQPVTW
jgi:hypothetical protein